MRSLVAATFVLAGCSFNPGGPSAGSSDASDPGMSDAAAFDADPNAPDADAPDADTRPACATNPSYVPRADSDHVYRYDPTLVDWDVAYVTCAADGAHMIIINDQQEQAYVNNTLAPGGEPWLGFRDLNEEGVFTWVDGSPETFERWDNNEPNNANGNEDCAYTRFDNRWNDNRCNEVRSIACECDPAYVAPPVPSCMTDPLYDTTVILGRRYRVEAGSFTAAQAKAACRAHGAHLPVITDDTEHDDLHAVMGRSSWIGYSDSAVENSFVWVDGSPSTFDRWGSGQPDSNGDPGVNGGEEDCVELRDNNNDWNDIACSFQLDLLCECAPDVTLTP